MSRRQSVCAVQGADRQWRTPDSHGWLWRFDGGAAGWGNTGWLDGALRPTKAMSGVVSFLKEGVAHERMITLQAFSTDFGIGDPQCRSFNCHLHSFADLPRKMHIKESFRRVEQVKSDADAAYEARCFFAGTVWLVS